MDNLNTENKGFILCPLAKPITVDDKWTKEEVNRDNMEARACYRQGNYYQRCGDYEKAIKQYEFSIQNNDNDNDYRPYYEGGVSLFYLERYAEAKKYFENAARIKPDEWTHHAGIGDALLGLKKYKEAEKCYEMVVKRFPSDSEHVERNLEECRKQILKEKP